MIELYNKKIKIDFKESNHSYWLEKNGKKERLVGVTTYCGILNKPFLIPWAVNTTVDYIKEHLELLKTTDGSGVLRQAREEADKQKNTAAEIGKAIHKWAEDYINKQNPEMPEDPKILTGVNNFLNWMERYKIKFIWSEKIIYSQKYNYVGTADIGIEIKGKKYLVDIKTGNALYPEVKLQTAAYLKALEEETGEKYEGRFALRISKETEEEYYKRMEKKNLIPPYQIFEAVYLDEVDFDFKGFLSAVNLYEWQKVAKNFNNIK